MDVKIHRGQNQIGGNIIEIATASTKILFDVGLDLCEANNKDLPAIEGLFNGKGYDGVFISHYHSDHLGLAYFINRDIPLYIGESSYKIVRAADDYKGVSSIAPKGFLHHGIPIVINDISVTPYLCDHSAFDSYMLLCEADNESILYTGDFRSNGRKSYSRLLAQLPDKIDRLICEGTTLSRKNHVSKTETELEEEVVNCLKDTDGPVFVLQSSTNIDRIVTMYRAAKRCRRIFLQDLYMADITSSIGGNIPNPAFDDVFPFMTNSRRYDGLCKYQNRVGKEFISGAQFVMCVRTSMSRYLRSLSKLMSFENGCLIYSFWDGYKETESVKTFLKVCRELGLKVITLHTSGHADAKAINQLIAKTNPTEILPIHTENPDWFKENLQH